jgi:hypothetical protein
VEKCNFNATFQFSLKKAPRKGGKRRKKQEKARSYPFHWVGAISLAHATGKNHQSMIVRAPIFRNSIEFYSIFMIRDPILPGPKAFGRGPGKIRASDHKN